jgi:hypothetical protein
MVVRLAESLKVPLRERNALLLAAGYAPAYQETRFDDPKLDAVRIALARVLDGHLPYPAVIVDRHGDLVAANDAFWGLTDGVAAQLREPPVNVPRLLLHPHALGPRWMSPSPSCGWRPSCQPTRRPPPSSPNWHGRHRGEAELRTDTVIQARPPRLQVGGGASGKCDDRPASRLSNRITCRP